LSLPSHEGSASTVNGKVQRRGAIRQIRLLVRRQVMRRGDSHSRKESIYPPTHSRKESVYPPTLSAVKSIYPLSCPSLSIAFALSLALLFLIHLFFPLPVESTPYRQGVVLRVVLRRLLNKSIYCPAALVAYLLMRSYLLDEELLTRIECQLSR
jgi:hypothetical protein